MLLSGQTQTLHLLPVQLRKDRKNACTLFRSLNCDQCAQPQLALTEENCV